MIDLNSKAKGRFSHAIESTYSSMFDKIKSQLRDSIAKLVAKNLIKRAVLLSLNGIPVVGTLLSVLLNIVSSAKLVYKIKKLYDKLVEFVKKLIKNTIKFLAKQLLKLSKSLARSILHRDIEIIKSSMLNEEFLLNSNVNHEILLGELNNVQDLVSKGMPLPLTSVVRLQLDLYKLGLDYSYTTSSLYYEVLKSKHNLMAARMNSNKKVMTTLGLILGSIGTALANKFGVMENLEDKFNVIKTKVRGKMTADEYNSSKVRNRREIIYKDKKSWYRTSSAITDYKFSNTTDISSIERQSINRYYGKDSDFTRSYNITSGYGHRVKQKGSENSSGYHWGIDYSAPKGTPVVAPMSGYVFYHGDLTSGAGRYITLISDSGKNVARFLHLSNSNESLGTLPELRGSLGKLYGRLSYNTVRDSYDWAIKSPGSSVHVNAGDVIGYTGASGKTEDSYSPHLHAEFGSIVKLSDDSETLVLITPDSHLVNDDKDTIDESTLVSTNDINVDIVEL